MDKMPPDKMRRGQKSPGQDVTRYIISCCQYINTVNFAMNLGPPTAFPTVMHGLNAKDFGLSDNVSASSV